MRYAGINPADIVCGVGVGIAVYVQGCEFHCPGCFNPQTWNFLGGKPWNEEMDDQFVQNLKRPYIKRLSILGGEPLHPKNLSGVQHIIKEADETKSLKKWIFTGYTWNEIMSDSSASGVIRREILNKIDYLVEGRFIEELKDLTLKFRGSSNQRILDVKKSLESGTVVLAEV